MRHRGPAPAERAVLFVFRAARLGPLLSAIPALLAPASYLCITEDPTQ